MMDFFPISKFQKIPAFHSRTLVEPSYLECQQAIGGTIFVRVTPPNLDTSIPATSHPTRVSHWCFVETTERAKKRVSTLKTYEQQHFNTVVSVI